MAASSLVCWNLVRQGDVETVKGSTLSFRTSFLAAACLAVWCSEDELFDGLAGVDDDAAAKSAANCPSGVGTGVASAGAGGRPC